MLGVAFLEGDRQAVDPVVPRDFLDEIHLALDVRPLVSYTDYLVICTARNERQAKAIAEEVQFRLKHDDDEGQDEVEDRSMLASARSRTCCSVRSPASPSSISSR